MNGLLSSGSDAIHMKVRTSPPDPAAMRMPMPRTRATPMASRPTMKSQSAQAAPAMGSNRPLKGPATLDRKPRVGDPPLIQAASPKRSRAPVAGSLPVP